MTTDIKVAGSYLILWLCWWWGLQYQDDGGAHEAGGNLTKLQRHGEKDVEQLGLWCRMGKYHHVVKLSWSSDAERACLQFTQSSLVHGVVELLVVWGG